MHVGDDSRIFFYRGDEPTQRSMVMGDKPSCIPASAITPAPAPAPAPTTAGGLGPCMGIGHRAPPLTSDLTPARELKDRALGIPTASGLITRSTIIRPLVSPPRDAIRTPQDEQLNKLFDDPMMAIIRNHRNLIVVPRNLHLSLHLRPLSSAVVKPWLVSLLGW